MNHNLVITLTDEQEKKLVQAYAAYPATEELASAEDLLSRWARHTPVMELERVELADLTVIKAKLTTATDKEIADVKAALKIAAVVAEEPVEPVK